MISHLKLTNGLQACGAVLEPGDWATDDPGSVSCQTCLRALAPPYVPTWTDHLVSALVVMFWTGFGVVVGMVLGVLLLDCPLFHNCTESLLR